MDDIFSTRYGMPIVCKLVRGVGARSWSATWLMLLLLSLFTGRAAVAAPTTAESGIVECTDDRTRDSGDLIIGDTDYLVCFQAYVSNFDTGSRRMQSLKLQAQSWGIPHWVLQRVERSTGSAEGHQRPSRWFTIPALASQGQAPTDDSYRFSQRYRSTHPDWYERGHLAQKYLAERLNGPGDGPTSGPGWFTHNVANAVPQRGRFNKGPWLTLECFTGAWANRYHGIWILSGPVFAKGFPTEWLSSDVRPNAAVVAIPDMLFKIVARRVKKGEPWDLMAFVYPQDALAYRKGPWDPKVYVTSVKRVEALTGLVMFPDQPDSHKAKEYIPEELWKVETADFDKSCRRFAPKVHK